MGFKKYTTKGRKDQRGRFEDVIILLYCHSFRMMAYLCNYWKLFLNASCWVFITCTSKLTADGITFKSIFKLLILMRKISFCLQKLHHQLLVSVQFGEDNFPLSSEPIMETRESKRNYLADAQKVELQEKHWVGKKQWRGLSVTKYKSQDERRVWRTQLKVF